MLLKIKKEGIALFLQWGFIGIVIRIIIIFLAIMSIIGISEATELINVVRLFGW